MKTQYLLAFLSIFWLSNAQGQDLQSSTVTSSGTIGVQKDTPFEVVGRGGNQRVWQRTTYETTPSGKQIPHIHKYTEVTTGMHYLKKGQWVESKEEIDILPNGTAAATQGQHKAYFPGDIAQGVIEVVTPDGIHMNSRPVGLSYDDGNNTVLIAQLQNSVGVVMGSNQVIYANAFTDFAADLVYTYTKGGFEQDVVLRDQPPSPESFGLNPQTTKLQVLTEFFNTPAPAQRAMPVSARKKDRLSDTILTFGQMKMVQGKAFSVGNSTQARSRTGGTSTYKSWLQLQGRTFLMEELPYQRVASQLEQLPLPVSAGAALSSAGNILHKVSARRLLPAAQLAQAGTNTVQLTRADLGLKRGVVLDYVTVNSAQTNYIFKGDTTYYVSGGLVLSGITTFEGGTVIKFSHSLNGGTYYYDPVSGVGNAVINIPWTAGGQVNCPTAPYRPAVLTSMDDNSVGETISGSSGSPGTLSIPYIMEDGSLTLFSNLRFCYAGVGVYENNFNGPMFRDCQFIACGIGFAGWGNGCMVFFENCLLAGVIGIHDYSTCDGFTLQNVTLANSSYNLDIPEVDASLYQPDTFYTTLTINNSLFAGGQTLSSLESVISSIDGESVNDTANADVSGNAFQRVGAGKYYLTNNSPYRNVGTTNIDSTLLAELRLKTTFPPIAYSGQIVSTNMSFSPQAQRDTDVPDLGYHYDPIDYALSGIYVTNTTITVNAGTVIAAFRTNDYSYGIGLSASAKLNCQGLANSLSRIVEYNTVQEQGTNSGWRVPYSGLVIEIYPIYPPPSINCNFTDWSVLEQDTTIINCNVAMPLNIQNCQFHGGLLYLDSTFSLTNCLFERVNAQLWQNYYDVPVIRNCLFYGGTLDFYPNVNNAIVKDNLFDQTVIPEDLTGWGYDGGKNAFVTNNDRMLPVYANDLILSNSPAYQVGLLGNYYQPDNSPLINKGGTNANLLGLYHFTTQTNEVKETNSIVDIGYHYVATDTYGNPLDTDGDGIPDYLEDANGNGVFDAGDLGNWLISSFNGLTTANGLSVFTPLK